MRLFILSTVDFERRQYLELRILVERIGKDYRISLASRPVNDPMHGRPKVVVCKQL